MIVGAIVLAAGSARRMGADKLGADLGGKPVLDHVLDAITAAGLPDPLVAVPPRNGRGLRGRRVEVADHALGMGHSLAAAAAAIPADWDAVIVALGDMPLVRARTFAALAAAVDRHAIVVPVHEGRRGNPVAWGRDHFAALAALTGDRGGKALIDANPDRLILLATDDAGVRIDIDTPDALDAARTALGAKD